MRLTNWKSSNKENFNLVVCRTTFMQFLILCSCQIYLLYISVLFVEINLFCSCCFLHAIFFPKTYSFLGAKISPYSPLMKFCLSKFAAHIATFSLRAAILKRYCTIAFCEFSSWGSKANLL
jgi:hypothetical protein